MEQPATVELFRECDQSGTLAQQHVGLQGRRVRPAKRQLESGDYKAGETLQYRYLRNRRGSPCGLRRQGARATRRICTSAIDAAYSTSGADRRAPLYKKDRFAGGFAQGRADRLHPLLAPTRLQRARAASGELYPIFKPIKHVCTSPGRSAKSPVLPVASRDELIGAEQVREGGAGVPVHPDA